MKKLFYISVFFLAVVGAKAQQFETYSQYLFNQYALNPGFVKTKCIDVKIGSRVQWLGFDGQPWTSFGSINIPLTKSNMPARSRKDMKHVVGAYIINDVTGRYQYVGFNVSYTVDMQVSHEYRIGAGFFIGARQHTYRGTGSPDPATGPSSAVIVLPDINPGIWLYSKKNFFGFSVKSLYKNKLSGIGGQIGSPSGSRPHFYITAGQNIKSKAYHYSFHPSIMVKWQVLIPPAVDLNFMMFVKNKIGLGLAVRNREGVIALLKFNNIIKGISVGYSFDFTTSKIRYGTSARTHEIILSMSPCGRDNEESGKAGCAAYD